MFFLTQPTPHQVDAFLAAQREASYSYTEVGASRHGEAPGGYTVDRNRVRLGSGLDMFRRAERALRDWRMFSLGWVSVWPLAAPVAPGTIVAVCARHYGFWSLNASRILYVMDGEAPDEPGVRRSGFGYGTLPAHGEIGEERFSVEWHESDDSVWYDLYAFSRPGNLLAKLGYPLGRRVQKRFAQGSKRAMVEAVLAS